MCTVIPCGCGQTTVGGSILQITGLAALAGGAAVAVAGPTILVVTGVAAVAVAALAFGPTRKAAWWLTRKMLAPAVALTATAAALWLAGRSFTPRSRQRRATSGATWLRAGARVADSRTDVHWYAWPGWQRTVARVALLGVVTAAYLAPVITALVALLITVTVTARIAVLLWARRRDNAPVLRVKAIVGYPLPRRIGPAPTRALPADVVDAEVIDLGTARYAVRG